MLFFLKGGGLEEKVFPRGPLAFYIQLLIFLQEGLIYIFIPKYHCHLSKCTVYRKKKKSTFLASHHDSVEKEDKYMGFCRPMS